MVRTATAILALAAAWLGSARADGQDSGDTLYSKVCIVDGGEPRTGMSVRYNRSLILFCCTGCRAKFIQNPQQYLSNPAQPPKPPAADKPASVLTGPCDCRRIVKGLRCPDCDRDLAPDDVRNGLCKKCEVKAVALEYCVKDTDKARVSYACSGCEAKAGSVAELKHDAECKAKLGAPKKICAKSGQAPHATAEKK